MTKTHRNAHQLVKDYLQHLINMDIDTITASWVSKKLNLNYGRTLKIMHDLNRFVFLHGNKQKWEIIMDKNVMRKFIEPEPIIPIEEIDDWIEDGANVYKPIDVETCVDQNREFIKG